MCELIQRQREKERERVTCKGSVRDETMMMFVRVERSEGAACLYFADTRDIKH